MLVSIALGLFILGIVYVAIWSVKNDAAKTIGDQVGFIRMRLPRSPKFRAGKRNTSSATSRADGPKPH